MNAEETDRDEFSVEYVVVANDLLLALIRRVQHLEDAVRGLDAMKVVLPEADVRYPPVRLSEQGLGLANGLTEIEQARRDALMEEQAFLQRVHQDTGDDPAPIVDTSSWPVYDVGEHGDGFR